MNSNAIEDLTVLVVDDEEFALKLAEKVLNAIGIGRVVMATDAQQALDLMANTTEDIGLIISDISMPDMDGYAFARRVRYGAVPRFKNLPILMLTGHDTEHNIQKARTHKINGYIVKPAEKEKLETLIRQVIGA